MVSDTNTDARAIREAAAAIAAELGETERMPIRLIRRIVKICGLELAAKAVEEARDIHARGDLMVNDASRRRTLGGIFFWLIRRRTSGSERRGIFHPPRPPRSSEPKTPPLRWNDRFALVSQTLNDKGEARTVKITVIGRPGHVAQHDHFVVTTMEARKHPALPKGLPAPPPKPSSYTVYLSQKHWKKVREPLKDPEDLLIVEGFCSLDAELETIAVFGTNATTKLLQRALREAQGTTAHPQARSK